MVQITAFDGTGVQRGINMFITPQEVLDTSVAQLETLAAFLREQLDESIDDPGHVTTETRVCKEILGSLRVLILRVRPRALLSTGGLHVAGRRLERELDLREADFSELPTRR